MLMHNAGGAMPETEGQLILEKKSYCPAATTMRLMAESSSAETRALGVVTKWEPAGRGAWGGSGGGGGGDGGAEEAYSGHAQ